MRGIIRARGKKDGRCMILFPTVIILKAFFSSDTHQSIKRPIVTERLAEIYTQMQLHVIGCV